MDDDDVQKALAFLRNHEAETTVTGAPVAAAQLTSLDLEAINADFDDDMDRKNGHEPVGPNWKKPGPLAQFPKIASHPDSAWLMHERQDQSGKYKAWLFFSKVSGEYYRVNDAGNGYVPMPTPHKPWSAPLIVRAGNASVLAEGAAKLDMSVLLPDLPKTGFLLKQPLEFLDKPSSLFVLCAGLRNTCAAAEFCAKRFHSALLPKLSSKPTTWYDRELVAIMSEAAKVVDKQLLESQACFAGCSLAVCLLSGCRLVVASLGSTRCLLCKPGLAQEAKKPAGSAPAPAPWTARPIAGTGLHSLAQESEAQRVESAAGSCPVPKDAGDGGRPIFGRSVAPSALAEIKDEWERELRRTVRAANSFAVLGLTPKILSEGKASLRKQFRKKSLVVHPDKVGEERRQRSTEIFSKLEASINLVESMLQTDAAATALLAEIHCAHDEGRLGADAGVAAALLGVTEGCTPSEASKAAKKKFQDPLNRLQNVARSDVERALQILEVAQESASRGTQLWSPPEVDVGVQVTRALGCKDLKSPARLLSSDLTVEMVQLGVGDMTGLALLAEGAEDLSDVAVAQHMATHAPGRPRAAALRIALEGARLAKEGRRDKRKAISVVCAFFRGESMSSGDSAPPAKRQRSGYPDRVRMSHILLRWAGIKGGDEFERPGMPAPTRTQAQAERELLELAEKLLAARDPKTLGARFKAMVMKHSECQTALNVPHADLGWLEPGGSEPPFEAAAFDTPLGGLSDVVVTSRGAHLMYRLG